MSGTPAVARESMRRIEGKSAMHLLSLLTLVGCGLCPGEAGPGDGSARTEGAAQAGEPAASQARPTPLVDHRLDWGDLDDACQPKPRRATVGDPPVPVDPTAFTARARAGAEPALEVELDAASGLAAGTYTVTFGFPAGCFTAEPAERDLELRVVVPAVVVDVPEVLRVERRTGLLGAEVGESSALWLRPTGRRGLTDLRVYLDGVLEDAQGGLPAQVTVAGVPTALGAGERFDGTPLISGALKPGDATGTLLVQARQLDAPLRIPVEVRVRRWPADIFLIVLSGVLAGAVLRVLLPLLRDRAGARASLLAAQAELARLAEAQADPPTRRSLAGAAEELGTLGQAWWPASDRVRAAVEEAERKRDTAFTELATRRAQVTAALEDVAARVRRRYPLPGAVVVAYGAWHAGAATAIEEGNVEAAAGLVGEAGLGLAPALDRAMVDWTAKTRAAFAAAEALGDLARVGDAEGVVRLGKPGGDVGLDARLDAAQAAARALAERLDAQAAELARLRGLLVRLSGPGGPDTAPATNALDSFDRALASDLPDAALEALLQVSASLPVALGAIARAQAAASGEETRRQAAHHLAHRGFGAALVLLSSAQIGSEEGVESVFRAARGVWARFAAASPAPVPAGRAVRTRTLARPAPAKAHFVHLLTTASWHLGAAVVLSMGAYRLFAAEFVGAGPEVVGIFLWAFGLDYTADTLKEQVMGAATSPKVPGPQGAEGDAA